MIIPCTTKGNKTGGKVMNTIFLWMMYVVALLADRKFCNEKAKRMGISVLELIYTKSEISDFVFDILDAIIAIAIIITTATTNSKITFSMFVAILAFAIPVHAFVMDIKRRKLSK